jgi:hypothetical protein
LGPTVAHNLQILYQEKIYIIIVSLWPRSLYVGIHHEIRYLHSTHLLSYMIITSLSCFGGRPLIYQVLMHYI